MNITHMSNVGIDPAERFNISLLKVETNDKKDQVTFHAIIKHDSGSIPEGTVIQTPFLTAVNSKDKTKYPIWFEWKPEIGAFGFTMEIDPSPNSDVIWRYQFETTITSPDSKALMTFETRMSKFESAPKVTLISSSILDNKLKVVTKVTRDDGRKTKRAFPVLVRGTVSHQWDSVVSELTTIFTLDNPIGSIVEIDLSFDIGIEETQLTSPVTVKSPVPRTKTMRSRVVGSFVENGELTFVANFRWANSGLPPETLSIPSTLESGTNVPSGSIKTKNVLYDPSTGDLRVTIKVNEAIDAAMTYELTMLVTATVFDPKPITLVVNTHAREDKFTIVYEKPFVQNLWLLLPFKVYSKANPETPVNTMVLNDYQRKAMMGTATRDQTPVIKIINDVAHLAWVIDIDNSKTMNYSFLGVYSFGRNEFLYDVKMTLNELSITSVTTEVGIADIVEKLSFSNTFPLGTIKLAPSFGDTRYPTELVQTGKDSVEITFRGAARTFEPVQRLIGCRLVFTSDHHRTLVLNDKVDLYMSPGEGELKVEHISSYLINKKTIEVVNRIAWEDGTYPIKVKMDNVLDTPKGPVAVKRWEYESKTGILRYYVDVIPSGKKDEFEFKAILNAPEYNIFIGPVTTKVTIGSNFYPYVVGPIASEVKDDNQVRLEFPLTYLDGSAVGNVTEVLSVEEVYPNSGQRKFTDFEFKDGTVSLTVTLGAMNWETSNYSLQIRFGDDKVNDNSDKLAVVDFNQKPKFDASIDYGWMEHSRQAGKLITKIIFDVNRHDKGKTQYYALVDGQISNCTIAAINFRRDLTGGTITVILNDPNKSAKLKGSIDLLVDGNPLTMVIDDTYHVPGFAEYKGMKVGEDPEYPLEVTWVVGGWTSHHSEHVTLNDRRWKNLIDIDGSSTKSEWNQVTSELVVKFKAKLDPTADVRYSGDNVFMLPSPDMTVYDISFDGVIKASKEKTPFLSVEPIGEPVWNNKDESATFKYKVFSGNGNISVVNIDHLYAKQNPLYKPEVVQDGDIITVIINADVGAVAAIFDITFESDAAYNVVTLRDSYNFSGRFQGIEILFAEILPKTDTMRVYWSNPGVSDLNVVIWEPSSQVRYSTPKVKRDPRSGLLYSDHIVYLNTYEDVRHNLGGYNRDFDLSFKGTATIYGTNKPYDKIVVTGQPKVTIQDKYVEYVYPVVYQGTEIGPKSVVGKVIDQTGTFDNIVVSNNPTARTVTVRVNKYPFLQPAGFHVVVELRDSQANEPTFVRLDV